MKKIIPSKPDDKGWFRCQVCGQMVGDDNFCRNCGQQLREIKNKIEKKRIRDDQHR